MALCWGWRSLAIRYLRSGFMLHFPMYCWRSVSDFLQSVTESWNHYWQWHFLQSIQRLSRRIWYAQAMRTASMCCCLRWRWSVWWRSGKMADTAMPVLFCLHLLFWQRAITPGWSRWSAGFSCFWPENWKNGRQRTGCCFWLLHFFQSCFGQQPDTGSTEWPFFRRCGRLMYWAEQMAHCRIISHRFLIICLTISALHPERSHRISVRW